MFRKYVCVFHAPYPNADVLTKLIRAKLLLCEFVISVVFSQVKKLCHYCCCWKVYRQFYLGNVSAIRWMKCSCLDIRFYIEHQHYNLEHAQILFKVSPLFCVGSFEVSFVYGMLTMFRVSQ